MSSIRRPARNDGTQAALYSAVILMLAVLAWSPKPAENEPHSDPQRYQAKGMVLRVDVPHRTITVSCQAIPGYMEAMVMPFAVHDVKELAGLAPGTAISFTLVVQKDSSYAEAIQIQNYQGLEVDPLTARRLALLNRATDQSPQILKPLAIGQDVPDFTLLDQTRRRVTLSNLSGKVVLLNFVYTRCALPDFCFRSSNNFGQLQKRFRNKVGRDLILLTISFDPVHDQPDVLARYAGIWKAESNSWHFLTGSAADVQRICALFAVDAFPDEGLLVHSLHTVVIGRNRKLVANIEGNQFSAQQLGDLVQTVLDKRQ